MHIREILNGGVYAYIERKRTREAEKSSKAARTTYILLEKGKERTEG